MKDEHDNLRKKLLGYCAEGAWLSALSLAMMMVVIPLLSVGFVNTNRRFETAINLLIDGGFILSLLGIVESITKINLFQLFSNANGLTFFHEVRYGFLRIMGTFGQPISYGLYHVFIIALIIYRLKNYTQYSQKHTFLKVAYLLSVINILLTVSRIPIIACILLHILLLYKKSKKEFINYAVAISILLLLLIIFNDTVIVDFMAYSTQEFSKKVELFLESTDQYFFLSSSRVYAASNEPLTEDSPRLLDVCTDETYLATDEYALAKARQENILLTTNKKNWTIIRPYKTYNNNRLQLGMYEKEEWLYRLMMGKTLVFPNELKKRKTIIRFLPMRFMATCRWIVLTCSSPKRLQSTPVLHIAAPRLPLTCWFWLTTVPTACL